MRISDWSSDVCSSDLESLTVTEIDPRQRFSRITVVTSGTPQILEQIKAQLDRLVPVHRVSDLSMEGPSVERELALVKVAGAGEKRVESLRIADIFRARVVDSSHDHFVFEMTGKSEKLDRSEEHTSELQSLMRISYAVFCLKK